MEYESPIDIQVVLHNGLSLCYHMVHMGSCQIQSQQQVVVHLVCLHVCLK